MTANPFELERTPQAWGNTTNPVEHDPANYRYLVHAVDPAAIMNAMLIVSYDAKGGVTYNSEWGDQSISMYDHPERLAERVSLSMSLLDQDHTATWGDAGLIVEASEENIVIATSSDVGVNNSNRDFLLEQSKKYGVMSPDSLLENTSPHAYNEVVAIANNNGSQVRLAGFFYKATSKGKAMNEMMASRMKNHAARLGLPVVAIANQSWYSADKVERGENDETKEPTLAANFNGSRYYLEGFNDVHQFKVIDESGSGHFMAPHELKTVLDNAVATGELSQDEAAKIIEEYTEADRRRQIPTAKFGKDGEFKEIVSYEGYGDNEFRASLHKSGYGYRTNVARQAERNQEAMINLSRKRPTFIGNEDDFRQRLSPDEASKMVQAACEDLDGEKAAVVRQWYDEHRSIGEKQWYDRMQSRHNSIGRFSIELLNGTYEPPLKLELPENLLGIPVTGSLSEPSSYSVKKDAVSGDMGEPIEGTTKADE